MTVKFTVDYLQKMDASRLILDGGDQKPVKGKTSWKGMFGAWFRGTSVSKENKAVWSKLRDAIKGQHKEYGEDIARRVIDKYNTSKPLSSRKAVRLMKEAQGRSYLRDLKKIWGDVPAKLAIQNVLKSNKLVVLGSVADEQLKEIHEKALSYELRRQEGVADESLLKMYGRDDISQPEDIHTREKKMDLLKARIRNADFFKEISKEYKTLQNKNFFVKHFAPYLKGYMRDYSAIKLADFVKRISVGAPDFFKDDPEAAWAAASLGKTDLVKAIAGEHVPSDHVDEIYDAIETSLPLQVKEGKVMIKGQQYKIGKSIGSGGNATAFRLENMGGGDALVLKMSKPGDDDEATKTRDDLLLKEAEIHRWATLKGEHPNIVQVMGIVRRKDRPCMVMEFVDGIGKKDLKKNLSILPKETRTNLAIFIMKNTLKGLQNIHKSSVSHLDMNLSNIIIDGKSKQPKIIDFGAGFKWENPDSRRGTALYNPPEVVADPTNGESYSDKTDIFSMGVTFYEMLTGEEISRDMGPDVPFYHRFVTKDEAESVTSLETVEREKALLRLASFKIRKKVMEVSPECSGMVMRMLEPSSQNRPTVSAILSSDLFSGFKEEDENRAKLTLGDMITETAK